jgi:hypothetical protein
MYRYVVALANEKHVEVDANSEEQALRIAHRKHGMGVLWAERKMDLGIF